jgi:hypothetical protein
MPRPARTPRPDSPARRTTLPPWTTHVALVAAGSACLAGAAGAQVTINTPSNKRANFEWVGAAANHTTNPVKINGVDIGRLDFSHRLLKNPTATNGVGGLALAGGFTGTGNNPFPDFPVDPNLRYDFVQSIFTNTPAAGRRGAGYVDSDNPRVSPFYPFGTAVKNPQGNAFTKSYYDAPQRPERTTATNWDAELALVCTNPNRRTLGVVGSFLWGFNVAANANPGNGNIAVTRSAGTPTAFGTIHQPALGTMEMETRGTKTQQGWTVGDSRLCSGVGPPKPRGAGARSENTGQSRVIVENPSTTAGIDQVLVFPRNHALGSFAGMTNLGAGWSSSSWGSGTLAPTGLTMFQPGILFSGTPFTGGDGLFDFTLAGNVGGTGYSHESFFDVFLHGEDGTWSPFAYQTQELLGDLNDDGDITSGDLSLWDTMFGDPAAWESTTGWNSLWRGDFDHDGTLTPADRALFAADVSLSLEYDAVAEGTVTPEPRTFLLLGAGLLGLLAGARRRRAEE